MKVSRIQVDGGTGSFFEGTGYAVLMNVEFINCGIFFFETGTEDISSLAQGNSFRDCTVNCFRAENTTWAKFDRNTIINGEASMVKFMNIK